MPGRTGGKDYPIRWPHSAMIAYTAMIAFIILAVGLVGFARGGTASSAINFLLANWPLFVGVSLVGATITNGILIFQDVRRSRRKPPLTNHQWRFVVAVSGVICWTFAWILYVVWKPAGLWWTIFGFALYLAGIFAIGLIARVPEVEKLELEKRVIEFQDELQFTKENPDPRSIMP